MPTNLKLLLSKTSKGDRIRFGYSYNHVMMVIQKLVLLLNLEAASSTHNCLSFPANKQGTQFFNEVVTGYNIKSFSFTVWITVTA